MILSKQQVGCIVFKYEKDKLLFLLLKRIKSKGGFWQFVSGGTETKDKTLIDAMYRELFEETGINKEDVIKVYRNIHVFTIRKHYLTKEPIIPLKETMFAVQVKTKQIITDYHNLYKEHEQYEWVDYKTALSKSKLRFRDNKNSLKELMRLI
jgi:8-oxo-dGTP pyrophosphatase MutT (NUDIX family)